MKKRAWALQGVKMKHKKIKISVLLFCLAWLFCGCQETPQEVRDRMGSYGENRQMASKERKYCTIDELKKAKLSEVDVELDNIKLPKDVDFSDIESIAFLELSFEENYTKQREEALKLFGIEETSLVSDTLDTERNMGRTVTYDNPAQAKYLAVEDNGFVSFIGGLTYDFINDKAKYQDTPEKYDLDMDDISGKMVELKEGETEIAAVRESAEQWLDDNMPMEGCEYRISDVYVRELDCSGEQRKQLSLYAEICCKGLRFNSYASVERNGARQVDFYMHGIQLNYDGMDALSFYSNGVGKITINSREEIDEVIDLQSAVQRMNEEMSGFRELNISKILPMYVLYPIYETDEEPYAVPGQKLEGRPVYAFIIEEGVDDTEFGINKSNATKVIFVDMVTGEVTTDIG